MQRESETFDAIVVGSGISGGWAAKELTERGLRVLMLERGKMIEHGKDYTAARKAPWDYPHRGGRTRELVEAYPVLSRDYPLNEKKPDWWVNERESPYTEVKRFDWYRGYHVGGRSLTWGRQSYRHSDLDFEANAKEGHRDRLADSLRRPRAVVRPRREPRRHQRIARRAAAAARRAVPAGDAAERRRDARWRAVSSKQFEGQRRIIPGRVANLTQPIGRRGRCQFRNACRLGCPYGAYFSTQSSTLPAAEATGPAHAEGARHRRPTWSTTATASARPACACSTRITKQTTVYSAKVVFLCASTLNSTWILLRSATDVWPGGLGSSSGELGHNLMDHHFRCGASGVVRRVRRPRTSSASGPRASTSRASATSAATSASTCAASATRAAPTGKGGSARSRSSASAAAFKDEMATPGPWRMGATAFGEMLPNHANRVTLDAARTDAWGLPVLAIDCETGENERLMRRDMMNDMAEMLEAAGVKRRARQRQRLLPGHGHSRDGHGAHGPRSEDVGAQRAQPGVGRAERVRHRRLVHDLGVVREPVAHLHGAHGARGGLRGRRAEAREL